MAASKRPVNLSLNVELVSEARQLTGNLSGVVESLLSEFIDQERAKNAARNAALKQASAMWNRFSAEHGSFADEHSTL